MNTILEEITLKLARLALLEERTKHHTAVCLKYQNERYRTDPEYRQRRYETSMKYQKRKYLEDPAYKELVLKKARDAYYVRKLNLVLKLEEENQKPDPEPEPRVL